MPPEGYCQCGCGERTSITTHTRSKNGAVKGKPTRWLTGHHLRKIDHYEVEDRGYTTPCWVWKLATNPKGYGRLRVPNEDRKVLAYRWYYERHVGPVPDGLQLDHLCRVPACVNPDHLEPVTAAENTRRGANAKLTLQAAREIRASDESLEALAATYGVSPITVRAVLTGRTWREDPSDVAARARILTALDGHAEGDVAAIKQRKGA